MKLSNEIGVVLCLLLVALVAYVAREATVNSSETYTKTERGLIRANNAQCKLGMVTTMSAANILNENGNPITCTGYIKLTDKEKAEYELKGLAN